MEVCDLNDRDFKIAILKKLKKILETTDRDFNELRNKINKQKAHLTRKMNTLKKNQREILEKKNSIKEMKNKLASLGNRAVQMEKRISDI